MKSKTSFFNRTILKKNLTHFWPLWALYFVVLFFAMPFSTWQMATGQWYHDYYGNTGRMYRIIESAVQIQTEPVLIFIVAAVMALAIFSYLYSAKNANMMHALPVNRLELYVTNYLSGLLFLFLPQIINFFLTVLVAMANEITCIQYLFAGLVIQMEITLFAYSLAVFVAMFTGQILAMPVYYIVVNFLFVGCMAVINGVMSLLSYGVDDRLYPGKWAVLSPLYYLFGAVRVSEIYESNTETVTGLTISGMADATFYAAAAVALIILAYRLYRRRQIETAGDWISIRVMKPVFRWGVAFCGSMVLSIMLIFVLRESHLFPVYRWMVVCVVLFGFVCFFVAEMLLCKSFKVFRKKRLIEWGGFTAAAVLFLTLFRLDVFGVERYVPEADEIEAAFVNMDYQIEVSAEDIPELLAIHRDLIEHREECQKLEQEQGGYYYTTFRYYKKDGTEVTRRYPVPVTGEYLQDETSAVSRITAWERREENLLRNMFGTAYDTNQYVAGSVDLYNKDGDFQSYAMDDEEIRTVVAAIEKDVRAGNFDSYYLYSIAGDLAYYNAITFDYYNENGREMWEYYSDYHGELLETSASSERVETANTSYINIGPDCAYTVEALTELGIINDTWNLYRDDTMPDGAYAD